MATAVWHTAAVGAGLIGLGVCRLLYGIHAILVLHNSREEEGYFSPADPPDRAAQL